MQTQRKRTVLAVDDDEINLFILVKTGEEAGYGMKAFTCGQAAWAYLQENPHAIDIVLLDKMMPGLSGIGLLRHIKTHDSLRHKPVILQTGDVGIEQMREALEIGAHYYLTKPFHPEILTAILNSANGECTLREELLAQMAAEQDRFVGSMRKGEFTVKTHTDAKLLAASLSRGALHREFAAIGLMELLANAIEHGNLEIGLEQKREWRRMNCWEQELAGRCGSTPYADRAVHVLLEHAAPCSHVFIRDEGKGFDWHSHLHKDGISSGLKEANGRGIAKAIAMLDKVRYSTSGNEVHCVFNAALPSSGG